MVEKTSRAPAETMRSSSQVLAVAAIFFVVLSMVAFGSLLQIKSSSENQLVRTLTSYLQSTNNALNLWAEEKKSDASYWSESPELKDLVAALLAGSRSRDALVKHPAQAKIRALLSRVIASESYQGIFVIAPDYTSIASMRDANLGVKNLLARQQGFLEKVFSGQTLISRPQLSDVTLNDAPGQFKSNSHSMFVVTPVKSDSGVVIAALSFRINPDKTFFPICNLNQLGDVGEQYFFFTTGEEVIGSRAPAPPLLANGYKEYLAPRLRAGVVRSGPGNIELNLDGYNDYRGISVVSAWMWNNVLDMGVAVELNYDEAFYAYRSTSRLVAGVLFIVALLSMILYVWSLRTATRNERILRKNQDETLKAKRELRILIDNAPIGIWMVDNEGGFRFVNRTFCEAVGIPDNSFISTGHLPALLGEGFAASWLESDRLCLAQESPQVSKVKIRHTDGNDHLLEVTKVEVTSDEGDVSGIIGIALDITERHKAEEKLRYSEQRFRDVSDAVGEYLWEIDADMVYTYVSERSTGVKGYSPEQLLGHTPMEFMHDEDIGAVAGIVNEAIASRASFTLQHRDIDESGAVLWEEVNGVPVLDAAGQVTGLRGTGMNITDRKRNELLLRRLSQAVEQAGESIMITDTRGTIEYVNPSFTRMTGYSAEEVLGKNPRLLKSGYQTDDYYRLLWKTISGGGIWRSAVIDRRKDGTQYPALMTISPIVDQSGEIISYVGTQQDMTEHQELEEKFRQAQKMEALGTLVGGIAHDFNNMLAGMTGNLYLARRKIKDSPEVVETLLQVEKLGYRAADMVKQLLVFSRRGSVELKPFDLSPFVKEISKLNEVSIPESIDFQTRFCPQELLIKADATQLHQVVLNLLNNARDAVTGVEAPVITLSVNVEEIDGPLADKFPELTGHFCAHLTVRDNGRGITAAEKEHIFEPFYTTKEVGQGTGLGLAMVYGAIEAHGGLITVDSTVGQGAAFHVYLPLLEDDELGDSAEESSEMVPGNGELLLLVDDNAELLSANKQVLESIGYHVIVASDGLDAVAQYTANHGAVALVVMDVVMPKLGGIKAVERIREMNPDVPVIFSTGYDKADSLISEVPSDEYMILSKPYSIEMLSGIIRKHIDSGKTLIH